MHGTTEGSAHFMLETFSYLSVDKNKGEKSEKSNYRPLLYYHVCPKYLRK